MLINSQCDYWIPINFIISNMNENYQQIIIMPIHVELIHLQNEKSFYIWNDHLLFELFLIEKFYKLLTIFCLSLIASFSLPKFWQKLALFLSVTSSQAFVVWFRTISNSLDPRTCSSMFTLNDWHFRLSSWKYFICTQMSDHGHLYLVLTMLDYHYEFLFSTK